MSASNDGARKRHHLGNLAALAAFVVTFATVAAISISLGGPLLLMFGLIGGIALAGVVGNTVGRAIGGEIGTHGEELIGEPAVEPAGAVDR